MHNYVAPNGTDSGPGTEDAPWRTLPYARDHGQGTVILLAGTYYLDSTLSLTSSLNWRNQHGEKVVVSGGAVVPDPWTLTAGVWSTPWTGSDIPRALWYDGIRCNRARTAPGAFSLPPGTTVTSTGYTTPNGYLSGWRNPADIEFIFWRVWTQSRLAVQSVIGNMVTMAPGFARFAARYAANGWDMLPNGVENGFETFAANLAPGTFYLDRSLHILYLVSPDGTNPNSHNVVVPILERLFDLQGVNGSEIRGLTFAHTNFLQPSRTDGFLEQQANAFYTGDAPSPYVAFLETPPAAISVKGCRNVTLVRNICEHIAGAGINVSGGSQDCKVHGNVVRDGSANGIQIGAPAEINLPVPTAQISVENNVVHDIGLEFKGAVGIIQFFVDRGKVRRNLVHHVPIDGISMGWGWGGPLHSPNNSESYVCELNEIHHYMQEMWDGGGIYCVGECSGMVRMNVVHDGGGDAVSPAFYLDNGATDITLDGNIGYSNAYPSLVIMANLPQVRNVLKNTTADNGTVESSGTNTVEAVNVVSTATAQAIATALQAGLSPIYADLVGE